MEEVTQTSSVVPKSQGRGQCRGCVPQGWGQIPMQYWLLDDEGIRKNNALTIDNVREQEQVPNLNEDVIIYLDRCIFIS